MRDVLLQISGLAGGYKKEEKDNILRGISLTLRKGETLGVLGLNGSGKSTFAKALMNLLPYRSGEIFFEGVLVDRMGAHDLSRIGIALMQQGGVLFNNLSVSDNLKLAFGGKRVKADYEGILASLLPPEPETDDSVRNDNNDEWRKRRMKSLLRMRGDRLSGGERQAVSLAMVLARSPRLLILDEPSAGLAPSAARSAYDQLDKVRLLNPEMSIILIEQNVAMAHAFCDRLIWLEQGRVGAEFTRDSFDMSVLEKKMFNDKG